MTRRPEHQRVFLILPLISLIYGWFLPAGLFIYWVTTTVFSIVQQFLINGYGGLFPLFGWTPGFAGSHAAVPRPGVHPALGADEHTAREHGWHRRPRRPALDGR